MSTSRGDVHKAAQQWAAAGGDVADELPLVGEFLDRSRRRDRAALERLSEAVARRALATVDHDPEQSLLLALAPVEECAPTLLAQRALLAALTASRVRAVLRGHQDWVVGWPGRPTAGGLPPARVTGPPGCGMPSAAASWRSCAATGTGSEGWPGPRTASASSLPPATGPPGYGTPSMAASCWSCAATRAGSKGWVAPGGGQGH